MRTATRDAGRSLQVGVADPQQSDHRYRPLWKRKMCPGAHGAEHAAGSFQFRVGSFGTLVLVWRDAVLYMRRPGTAGIPLDGVSAGKHVRL